VSRARKRESTVSLVGIIANPASGKDVRRLVSQAITVGNQQKANIVRRVLMGLAAVGVERIEIMPDHYGIGAGALDGLRGQPDVTARAVVLDFPVDGSADDTLRAAEYFNAAQAGCLVTLGGDGTVRVAARGCGSVPILPISTGTNNVVPTFIEGTVAGMAAGYVARQAHAEGPPAKIGDYRKRFCYRHKQLDIRINGRLVDTALVDVALIAARFVGARAVWEPDAVRQLFVTRAHPASIGLSALIGMLRPISVSDPQGATVLLGGTGRRVLAPIAPGTMTTVGIEQIEMLRPGVGHPVADLHPAVLALDGEREIELGSSDQAEVVLRLDGPWIVDVDRTLLWAVAEGMFVA
jgi:predicted polyphosphate/ATP-dependent NAD kinase